MTIATTGDQLICAMCLHRSSPDQPVRFAGGDDHEQVALCTDRVRCWARWDRAHQFENTEAIKVAKERALTSVQQ